MAARFWTVGIFTLAAFTCGIGSLHAEGPSAHVDGVSQIWVPTTEENPAGIKLFEPTHVYATRSRKPDRVWLLITDRDASSVKWRKDDDRSGVLRDWCKAEAASFVLFEFDSSGVPEMAYECGGGGALGMEMISVTNGLSSVAPAFEIFDGKRIRGRILSGKGWCGEGEYCEKTRDFMVDVEVQH